VKEPWSDWTAYHGYTVTEHQTAFDDLVAQGFRAVNLSFTEVGGKTYVTGLYDKLDVGSWVAEAGLSSAAYQTAFDLHGGQGMQLPYLSGYRENGTWKFSAIWDRRGVGGYVGVHDESASGFQDAFDTYAPALWTKAATGYPIGSKAAYAGVWARQAFCMGDADADGTCDDQDLCPFYPHGRVPHRDSDGNGIGNECECGDQNLNATVSVADLVAINLAIFNPKLATPLCDTNNDALCNVSDIVGAMLKIKGGKAYCSRYPGPVWWR
jgi:hypothetical protein